MDEKKILGLYASLNTIYRNTFGLVLLYAYEHEEDFKNWVKERLERGIEK